MFQFRAGSEVPFPEMISEGYSLLKGQICANISADRIKTVIERFIAIHRDEPLFFILELPSSLDDENEFEPGVVEAMHVDVYYIDGCTDRDALEILALVGDLLINDGLCSFGFGCHQSTDEIMFGKYNVTTIYSPKIKRYVAFMKDLNVARTDDLVTAWDTFTPEHPGSSERIETNGKSIFDVPEMLADRGIYKAEQREE